MAAKMLFSISSEGLPTDTHVVGLIGREALSEPYCFQIGLEIKDDSFDPDQALRSKAALTINFGPDTEPHRFNGVFADIELLHQHVGKSLYRVTLVPRLWHLGQSLHSRLYTDNTIIEIIEAVLKNGGLAADEFRFDLLQSYPQLEHVCQYKESDLHFISRWMEREGLYYFFEQSDAGETLVITDSRTLHGDLKSGTVRYVPASGADSMALEAFDSFRAKHSALPSSVKLTDYDYLRPTLSLEGSHAIDQKGLGAIQLFGENLVDTSEGTRYATVRAEEYLAKSKVFHGRGRVFHLRPNWRFTLDEHPNATYNDKEYLATELEHFANQSASDAKTKELLGIGDVEADEYVVHATAIASSVQYRPPRRHPWPRVDGYEIANISGEADSEYAQLDEHGRYKCRIKFDESDLVDGSATTWIRMMQPHGGDVEGFHFPLRKGTEVVVFFLAGDPDRPVVAGVVPNTLTQSPVTNANHTKNVIQTGGRNRLELEDLAGAQRVTLSTPYSNSFIRMGCPNDEHEFRIHTDDNTLLDAGQTLQITSGSWREDWVKAGRFDTKVDGTVTDTFNGTHTTTVKNKVTETYKEGHETTVNAAVRKSTYNAGQDTTVNGGLCNELYTGGHTTTVRGGNTTVGTTGETSITSTGKIVIKSTGADMEIEANKVDVKSRADWKWNVFGAEIQVKFAVSSETTIGIKNENLIGGKIESLVGGKLVAELAGCYELIGAVKNKDAPIETKKVLTHIKNGAVKVGQFAGAGLERYGAIMMMSAGGPMMFGP